MTRKQESGPIKTVSPSPSGSEDSTTERDQENNNSEEENLHLLKKIQRNHFHYLNSR